MPTPHYNYRPAAGDVVDQNEPTAYWNGKKWQKNKKNYGVPSGHRLVGRAGGPLNGWYYDWSQRAWMEPDKTAPSAPATLMPRPIVVRPTAQPQPRKESTMSKCDHSRKVSLADQIMEVAKVVSYIAGPVVIAVGQSIKPPAAPPVTATQPQWLIDQNQNTFQANNASYESRKGAWQNWGQALLTFGSSGLSKSDKDEIGKIVEKAMTKRAA